MPRFRFVVKDGEGARKSGGMDAPDLGSARKRLLQGGFEIVSLTLEGQPVIDNGDPGLSVSQRPSSKFIYIASTLLILSLLLAAGGWLRKPVATPQTLQPLVLEFSGQVKKDVLVVLDLPELPLHRETSTVDKQYHFKVELKVAQRPTYAWIQIVDGQRRGLQSALDIHAAETLARKLIYLKSGQTKYQLQTLHL